MKRILLAHRRGSAEAVHAIGSAFAICLSFLLRFDFHLEPAYVRMLETVLPAFVTARLAVFRAFGLRDLAWRYFGFEDVARILGANVAASVVLACAVRIWMGESFPRSIYIIDWLVATALFGSVRLLGRAVLRNRPSTEVPSAPPRRVLIYGAGQAGRTLLSEIRALPELRYQVAGFIDDDPQKRELRLGGLQVLGGRQDLGAVIRKYRIDEVLLALPAASGTEIARIMEACLAARITAKRIPRLGELIGSKVLLDQIREVRIEDLLSRPPITLDEAEIREHIASQTVLVTGAGGSVGGELCRQIARFRPQAIVGLDNGETALYHIEQEITQRFPYVRFHAVVANIQNRHRLQEVFAEHRPRVVYHAAAYKHVPMMEAHPFEAIENNVFGTEALVCAAAQSGVEAFALISSDKAVRPANVMGATKRLSELVCQLANSTSGRTRFMAVRFGNVLGSNGSVIPLFRHQIASGGPVTVTHPEMRRYFMTIPEAAQLVLQAGAMGAGGEIFVLEMGEQVRIVDLARKMILLSGLKPDEEIRIEFSGPRPGEKLSEELSLDEEHTAKTRHSQIRVLHGPPVSSAWLEEGFGRLHTAVAERDAAQVLLCLKELIPEYNPSAFLLRKALNPDALATERLKRAWNQTDIGDKSAAIAGAEENGYREDAHKLVAQAG